jgi:arylsulfatase A-like enzyme
MSSPTAVRRQQDDLRIRLGHGAIETATAGPTAGAVFSQYSPDAEYEQMTELRCVIGPRYKYAWNRQEADELYDTWADPAELHNLAADPALGEVRQTMRVRLQAWLDSMNDPCAAELRVEDGKQKQE